MNKYRGVIIEESLKETEVLKEVTIVSTKVEQVTEKHKTPWLKKWTLHTVEIDPEKAASIADKISKVINDNPSSWYADFNNGETFYVIYPNKIFKWEKGEIETIKKCTKYGISLGLPYYQVDFPLE